MDTREAVAARILELCAEQKMCINKLSNESAVPPTTLKNIISGVSRNPGIVTIKKLCDGMTDVTLADFFNTDVFRNLEQEIK